MACVAVAVFWGSAIGLLMGVEFVLRGGEGIVLGSGAGISILAVCFCQRKGGGVDLVA